MPHEAEQRAARRRRWIVATVVALVALAGGAVNVLLVDRALSGRLTNPGQGVPRKYTVDERLAQFGSAVAARLAPDFRRAGLPYPPREIALIAFKDQTRLELYGRAASDEEWRFVREYAVEGASGTLGPKLAAGDRQVPEGIYRAELLNANSRFHLSIRLDYPNEFDRRMAAAEGRSNLGSDIMIHGGSSSVGCLAMGDSAAEELFVLAALVGKENVRIVISPTDFHGGVAAAITALSLPVWAAELYATIQSELQPFGRSPRRQAAR